MRRSCVLAWLVTGLVATSAIDVSKVWAQNEDAALEPAAPPEADEEGRALFRAGELAFEAGRFDEALTHFRRAHGLTGRPELLFNVGIAADRAGRHEEAIESYEAFLRARPDATMRRRLEARLVVLRRLSGEGSASAPAAPETAALETAAPQADASVAGPMDPAEPSEPPRRRTWTWLTAATALAAGAAATGVWFRARSRYDALEASCAPSCNTNDVDTIERRVRTTRTLASVGALLAATSVVAFVWEGRARVEVGVSAMGARLDARF